LPFSGATPLETAALRLMLAPPRPRYLVPDSIPVGCGRSALPSAPPSEFAFADVSDLERA